MTSPLDLSAIRDSMTFAKLLGIELLEVTPELVRGRLEHHPERCTAGGIMHGGALMGLADSCGGVCAFFNLPDGAQGTSTIDSNTHFLKGVREGAVTAVSKPLHRGRTIIIVETNLTTDDGSPVAKVLQTQTFHYPRA
ncbi:MAG TPA: PaaI family thioesterase [Solirubrobacteraceae bacterium]|nr:PaaI family thioesterase [Solirubrobacteraceae bacterium]